MGTIDTPSYVVSLDDTDDPADAIDGMILHAFVAGTHPFAQSAGLARARDDAALKPGVGRVIRTYTGDGRVAHLVEGDGWLLSAARWKSGSADVVVVAVGDALARSVLEEAVSGASDDSVGHGEVLPVSFWHASCDGPRRIVRDIAVPAWTDIRGNYPSSARAALDQLVAFRPSGAEGRLLLLHGPPGTGKTTALRALARSWREWCKTAVIVDSDRLYGDSSYLMSVLLGDHDDDDDAPTWRLLVLEDCDELIRADAKKDAGQALGRLLNVTDGLVGQGLDLLVAITTNEPLGALHPAVARPGRCFGEVHVDRFSRREAAAWLGTAAGVPADGATLAELYALRGRAPVRAPELRAVHGAYL